MTHEGDDNCCKHLNVMNTHLTFAQKLLIVAGNISKERAVVMIDSGASRNFLSSSFARKCNIRINTEYRDNIRLANGQSITGDGIIKSLRVHLGPYTANLNFSVTQLTQGYDVILGKPWLTKVNPDINWKTNTIKIRTNKGTVVLEGINGNKSKYRPRLETSEAGNLPRKEHIKAPKDLKQGDIQQNEKKSSTKRER